MRTKQVIGRSCPCVKSMLTWAEGVMGSAAMLLCWPWRGALHPGQTAGPRQTYCPGLAAAGWGPCCSSCKSQERSRTQRLLLSRATSIQDISHAYIADTSPST